MNAHTLKACFVKWVCSGRHNQIVWEEEKEHAGAATGDERSHQEDFPEQVPWQHNQPNWNVDQPAARSQWIAEQVEAVDITVALQAQIVKREEHEYEFNSRHNFLLHERVAFDFGEGFLAFVSQVLSLLDFF